jgi:hypothetical protein
MSPMSVWSPITPWSQYRPDSPGGAASPGGAGSPGGADIPMRVGPQFQTALGGLSNLDRCNWCGTPRSAHGIDWSCPSGGARSGTRFAVLVAAAGVLALAGVALLTASSQTPSTPGTLGASGFLAAMVVLICTGTITGRRR